MSNCYMGNYLKEIVDNLSDFEEGIADFGDKTKGEVEMIENVN